MSSPFLKDILDNLTKRGKSLVDVSRYTNDVVKNLNSLCEDLLSMAGEASGVALAEEVIAVYESMNEKQKRQFFVDLKNQYGVDQQKLGSAVTQYQATPDEKTALQLNDASEPKRRELLRRINLAPGGTQTLVAMRVELLSAIADDPSLRIVDLDFKHLFVSWFNRGFLVMQRIDWNTSAAVLEKIIRYEAVHEIQGWEDLRRRIDPPDRRCYAFFHPSLEDEPLIFVEVALTADIPDAINPLLAQSREPLDALDATTAVFYSISNCQLGLRGITFGNFLIKQVVGDLKMNLPNLKSFVTLSPIPRLMSWLKKIPQSEFGNDPALNDIQSKLTEPDWHKDEALKNRLEKVLMPLAVKYFLTEKSREKPADPVARFHLGNGARLNRVNWLADTSENGLKQSAGMMVNYLYDVKSITKNHELYAKDHEVVVSNKVRKLLN